LFSFSLIILSFPSFPGLLHFSLLVCWYQNKPTREIGERKGWEKEPREGKMEREEGDEGREGEGRNEEGKGWKGAASWDQCCEK
jgi:hypothetical protein